MFLFFSLALNILVICKGYMITGQVDAPVNYTIGESFNISWNASALNMKRVNIYLSYIAINHSVEYWLLKSNVNNNGYDDIQPNLGNDLIYLSIPSQTLGNFIVSNSTKNSIPQLTTSQPSNLYQPMYMSNISGQLYSNQVETSVNIRVYLKSSIVEAIGGIDNINFHASYITSDDNIWTIVQDLNISNWTWLNNSNNVLYDAFDLNVYMILNEYQIGGPYILTIDVNDFEYYTVNGDYPNIMYQFVIYNPYDIYLSLNSLTYNEANITEIAYYENIQYNLKINVELYNIPLYIVMVRKPFQFNYYATSCNSLLALEWINNGKLGWKFQDDSGFSQLYIPPGLYDWQIYWAVTNDFWTLMSEHSDNYLFNINENNIAHDIFVYYNYNFSIGNYSNNNNNNNSDAILAVHIENSNNMGDNNELAVNNLNYNRWIFITSFSYNQILFFKFEQYNNSNYYLNENISETIYSFFYDEYKTPVVFYAPEGLIVNEDNIWTTYIDVYTYTCGGLLKISSRIKINTTSIGGGNNDSNDDWDTPVWAIVVVICVSVVWIILAMFCFRACKKKFWNADYQQLK